MSDFNHGDQAKSGGTMNNETFKQNIIRPTRQNNLSKGLLKASLWLAVSAWANGSAALPNYGVTPASVSVEASISGKVPSEVIMSRSQSDDKNWRPNF